MKINIALLLILTEPSHYLKYFKITIYRQMRICSNSGGNRHELTHCDGNQHNVNIIMDPCILRWHQLKTLFFLNLSASNNHTHLPAEHGRGEGKLAQTVL
jgi:hypothetical protein